MSIEEDDRGYLYGDALFETVRVRADGSLVRVRAHRDRMLASARVLGFDEARVDEAFDRLPARMEGASGLLRVTLSREGGAQVPFGGSGCCRVRWRPLPARDAQLPYRLCFVPGSYFPGDQLAEHKTASYLRAVRVRMVSCERGFDDGIRVSGEGLVSETSTANLFLARRDKEVWTPSVDGLLPGVTRATLIERLRARGVEVVERRVRVEDVLDEGTSEVWVSSVGVGVCRVDEVEGRRYLEDRWRALRGAIFEEEDSCE